MAEQTSGDKKTVPLMAAFSIIFVTVGLCCFIWQSLTAGYMFKKSRKPIVGLVFAQATLGIFVTVVTLITAFTTVSCEFRLLFSVLGVNLADMTLQFVLLWKAFLGNNRSKIILYIGCIPIISIAVFIIVNFTTGRSKTDYNEGYCSTDYPVVIVIAKSIIDCTSNAFLSACFVLVIHRHYRVLGSSIQKTLITEGLLYCFGVCLSNIVTGILLVLKIFDGNTPILYTIDWYLASYLIVKQLQRKKIEPAEKEGVKEKTEDSIDGYEEDEDFGETSVKSIEDKDPFKQSLYEEEMHEGPRERCTEAYYSTGSTLVAPSLKSPVSTRYSSTIEEAKHAYYGYPALPEGITMK